MGELHTIDNATGRERVRRRGVNAPREQQVPVEERTAVRFKAMRREAMILTAINNRLRHHCVQLQQEVDELARNSFRDPGTGLATQWLFSDRLRTAMKLADRTFQRVGLVRLRFDDSDPGTDPAVGEAMAREAARHLVQQVRASDTVCRTDDGEFLVLLPEIAEATTPALVARKLESALEPLRAGAQAQRGRAVTLQASTATYPANGSTERALLAYLSRRLRATAAAG